jgi:hypothetical protein
MGTVPFSSGKGDCPHFLKLRVLSSYSRCRPARPGAPTVLATVDRAIHNVVEKFNNQGRPVATVNFSVPDEVKDEFNETFAGQNKSAVIARLMRDAVEAERRQQLSHAAIRRILDRRSAAPRAADAELRKARRARRP